MEKDIYEPVAERDMFKAGMKGICACELKEITLSFTQ